MRTPEQTLDEFAYLIQRNDISNDSKIKMLFLMFHKPSEYPKLPPFYLNVRLTIKSGKKIIGKLCEYKNNPTCFRCKTIFGIKEIEIDDVISYEFI